MGSACAVTAACHERVGEKVQFISIAPSELEETALLFTKRVLLDYLNTAVGGFVEKH